MTSATRMTADLARALELSRRLDHLERAIQTTYEPSLRSLAAHGEQGAQNAYDELEEFIEALEWFRRDLGAILYADGDADRYEYYVLGLDNGALLPGERSDVEVLKELAADGGDGPGRWEKYQRGKALALAGEGA